MGDDFAFAVPVREAGVGATFASASAGDSAGFFAVGSEGSFSSAAGVGFCVFLFEELPDLGFGLDAVGFGEDFAAVAVFDVAAGVGFGVDLPDCEAPAFFFDSAPEAIRATLRNRTSSVRASRVME
jgi:hypothetical protein